MSNTVPRPRPGLLVGALAFSVLMGFQDSFTWQSYAGVVVASPLSEVAWASLSATLYVAIFALAVTLHVRGHRPHPVAPSVGVAFGWVMRSTTGRLVTLLFWCWVGFHFFAR